MEELLTSKQISDWMKQVFGYGQTNGSVGLGTSMRAMYNDVNEDNVLTTNGYSEVNFIACQTLLEKDDEEVMTVPNYMQIWEIDEEILQMAFYFDDQNDKEWALDTWKSIKKHEN